MAIISSFLCWNNTRTGSAVCAYYSLVVSVVCVSFYVFRYLALGEIEKAIEYKGIVYPGFVLYTIMIGVSLFMLPGVYMDKKYLLLPWVYTLVVTVLYETGAIALLTTVHLSEDKMLKGWEIASLCFYCFRLLANCYCFACVVSQYQELSEGRGTYDYLYKPRRRRRLTPPLADGDVYNPPYGAQLPPYSEVNPHKNYNPPDYENITVVYDNPAFCTSTSGTLSGCLNYADMELSGSEQSRERSDTSVRIGDVTDVVTNCAGTPTQHSFIAEIHHSSPKREVYRATYVTWI